MEDLEYTHHTAFRALKSNFHFLGTILVDYDNVKTFYQLSLSSVNFNNVKDKESFQTTVLTSVMFPQKILKKRSVY